MAYSSRVVAMGFFQGEVKGLRLGEEFHQKRVQLICSQISGGAPEASHRWSKPRLWRAAIELQHRGVLDLLPLITHRVPFRDTRALCSDRPGRAGPSASDAGVLKVRVAFLGCGGIAARHAQAAHIHPQLELTACCSRTLETTQKFAQTHGIRRADDSLGQMLEETRPELVVVNLPPYVRNGEIERIAQAGTAILIEKPIALDNATAQKVVEATENVTVAVGFMYRFGDAVEAWKNSDTGEVLMYAGAYHCKDLHASWWRDESRSGGQIVEQVIHQIDLMRDLMGELDTVYARRANLCTGRWTATPVRTSRLSCSAGTTGGSRP